MKLHLSWFSWVKLTREISVWRLGKENRDLRNKNMQVKGSAKNSLENLRLAN